MEINFNPIGIVHSPFKTKNDIDQQKYRGPQGYDHVRGELEIFAEYQLGLEDTDGFSHLIIIFAFHESKGGKLEAHPPRGDKKRGVFATRSPNRPNAIGLTIVKLEKRQDNILKVSGIDMIESTPILDIKPYTPRDVKTDTRFGWLEEV
jgi:tRNA-Thr(GGU) m(6)t(6)A37 methyltransferase TsaA